MYVYLFAIKTSGKRGQLEEQETTVPVIKTIVQLYPKKIIIYFENSKKNGLFTGKFPSSLLNLGFRCHHFFRDYIITNSLPQ